MTFKARKFRFGESDFRPEAPPYSPLRHEITRSPSSDGRDTPLEATASRKRSPPPESDEEAADRLKLTALAPFFERIKHKGEENARLRQMNNELAALNERQTLALAEVWTPDTDGKLQLEPATPHGTKRSASAQLASPMNLGSIENGENEHTTDGHLLHLARQIYEDLSQAVANEQIHLCGLGPLKVMDSHPDGVLDLAHQKLHTWPYKNVPLCWRRLYEDASLAKAASMLHEEADRIAQALSFKRRRLDVESICADQISLDWLTEVVTVLDKGITLTGSPGRADLFEGVLQQLEKHVKDEQHTDVPPIMHLARRPNFQTQHPLARAKKAMNFEDFQLHLNKGSTPVVIPATMNTWPALSLWQNPTYLLRLTLGGRRLVPVEVGKSYLDTEWSQKMMPFRDFMTDFLLSKEPKDVGYLAQHDLFAQIPALKNDIIIPDYCYTTPPPPDEAAARAAGLANARQLDEPLLNAWLGPKGTKTPLHTDPYHNILCQVVGYKYVRLYAPTETPKLYPCSVDDNGIDMSNTSQVDISHFTTEKWTTSVYTDEQRAECLKFPLLDQAKFAEGILGPGESLYIPLGWWHYVESFSTSFSVSFWWN